MAIKHASIKNNSLLVNGVCKTESNVGEDDSDAVENVSGDETAVANCGLFSVHDLSGADVGSKLIVPVHLTLLEFGAAAHLFIQARIDGTVNKEVLESMSREVKTFYLCLASEWKHSY